MTDGLHVSVQASWFLLILPWVRFVFTGRQRGVADSPIVPLWARRPERCFRYGT